MNPDGKRWRLKLLCGLSCLLLSMLGCQREGPSSGQRTPPNPGAPAVYGPPLRQPGVPSREIVRASGPEAKAAAEWRTAPFAILQTELSPAILVRSMSKQLELFAGSTNAGLGAPSYVAWSTPNGPRTFKNGEPLEVSHMRECWVLVWWAGASGWTNWDSPWVVYLQHQPEEMKLDGEGLHFRFAGPAGEVVLLPLYGYEKLAQAGHNFLAEHGLPARKIQTWDWPQVLKRDPLTRIRYWAAVTRQLPLYCEESISVDSAHDSVTIRSRFEWHEISDDWQTPRLKLAPLPPPLGHAAKLGGFPVRFSKSWFDLDYFTPYGPYLAIEGVDQFDATFSVLQFINEIEANITLPAGAPAVVGQALSRLQDVARRELVEEMSKPEPDDFVSTLVTYARAWPFYEPATRSNVVQFLRGRLAGPRGGSPGRFPSWWAYAHFTGDWDFVKERWPLVKRTFYPARQTHWVGFGCEHDISASGAASACVAFARMAYRIGDMDSYHYACAQLAREFVLLFLRQRGADYFRKHQPWHSLEFIDEEVFLTYMNTLDPWPTQVPGWSLGGPSYPADWLSTTARGVGRVYSLRWAGFHELDVARFYREYLSEDVRREVNWLQQRLEPATRWHDNPLRGPALVQLRSLLLNETPPILAHTATPEQFTGSPAGIMASCLALMRTAQPIRYERLIPPMDPSPFVAGLERQVVGAHSHLVTWIPTGTNTVRTDGGAGRPGVPFSWPELTWPGWATPTGASWTFGAVRAQPGVAPEHWTGLQWNWTTRVLLGQPRSP